MINLKNIAQLMLIAIFSSCSEPENVCDAAKFKELRLPDVSFNLKLPDFIVTDSVRYGDADNIFERKALSVDSSFLVFAGVTSYEKRPDDMPEIDSRMVLQKEQLEFGQDSLVLISECSKHFDNTKVGFLKYFDIRRNRYEGRIFFNRGMKFVDVWLFEKCRKNAREEPSVVDCVFESLEFSETEVGGL